VINPRTLSVGVLDDFGDRVLTHLNGVPKTNVIMGTEQATTE